MKKDTFVHRQPRHAAPKSQPRWSALDELNGREFSDRLRRSLFDAGAERAADTVERLAEGLGVAKKTVERWLAGDNLPTASQLYVISQRTGDSLDWLIGFRDVPRRRGDRSPLADSGTALRTRVEQLGAETYARGLLGAVASLRGEPAPPPAWRERLDKLPESPSDLVDRLALTWWDSQILGLGARWREALLDLEAQMRADSDSAQESSERSALRSRSEQLSWEAAQLDRVEGVLDRIDRLETRGPLLATSDFGGAGRSPMIDDVGGVDSNGMPTVGLDQTRGHQTPFDVLGTSLGIGLAWRGPKHDDAWFIDLNLQVRVRRRGRFLVEYEREDALMTYLLHGRTELPSEAQQPVALPVAELPLTRSPDPRSD